MRNPEKRMANSTAFKKGEKRENQGKRGVSKTTQAAKDAISQAAAELGGAVRLVEWVKEDPSNERVFWGTIYPKLLPLQVNGAGKDGEHLIKCTINLVAANGN